MIPEGSSTRAFALPRWAQSSIAVLALASSMLLLWLGRDQLRALLDIELLAIGAMLLINVAYYVFTSYRHLAILRVTTPQTIGGKAWFRLFVIGRTITELLPQGGHVYRSVLLKSELEVETHEYVASVLAYAWILNVQNLMVVLLILIVAPHSLAVSPGLAVPLIGITLVVVVASPFLAVAFTARLKRRGRLVEVARRIFIGLGSFARHKGGIIKATFFGVLSFAMSVATVSIAWSFLNAPLGVPTLIIFVAILQMGSTLSISPGNIGVAELGYAGVAALHGYDPAVGVLVGAVVRAAALVSLLLLSVPAGAWRTTNLLEKK